MHSSQRFIAALLATLTALASCSGLHGGSDLFRTGKYQLQANEIDGCTLSAAAFEENSRLVVRGRMTALHHENAPLKGTVRGEIASPSGRMLDRTSAPFRTFAHGRHHHPAADFELSFDTLPPAGSLVKLTHTLEPVRGIHADSAIR